MPHVIALLVAAAENATDTGLTPTPDTNQGGHARRDPHGRAWFLNSSAPSRTPVLNSVGCGFESRGAYFLSPASRCLGG